MVMLVTMKVSARELKDSRIVPELAPPGPAADKSSGGRWDTLIAAEILHPPLETGDPFEDWPDIRLPQGSAAELIDADRGEV